MTWQSAWVHRGCRVAGQTSPPAAIIHRRLPLLSQLLPVGLCFQLWGGHVTRPQPIRELRCGHAIGSAIDAGPNQNQASSRLPGWLSRLSVGLSGFGSGPDLRVCGFEPHHRLCAGSVGAAWDSLSLSLPLPCSLSLKEKLEKFQKKNEASTEKAPTGKGRAHTRSPVGRRS